MRGPHIAFRDVLVALGNRAIVQGVSVDLPLWGTTLVMGPSGAGKSTLCRAAVGLVRPASGSIEYRPSEGPPLWVSTASERELRGLRRRVPFVAQAPGLLDWLDLRHNVALAAREVASSEPAADEAAGQALEHVGLSPWAARWPREVGPGIRKRAAIARALVLGPSAVVLDEPTTGLDPAAAAHVLEALRDLKRQRIGVIAVSHDVARFEGLADTVIEVRDGRVAATHTHRGNGDA